jgi:hypothetical protein
MTEINGRPLEAEFTVFSDDTLREVANRFAQAEKDTATVVDRVSTAAVGQIAVRDLLEGRLRNIQSERDRERMLLTAGGNRPGRWPVGLR